jgi:hypothetical protein
MTKPRQINQGGAQGQERPPREETEPQRHREQRPKQKKAEGDRDELGFSKDDESQWG